jgi:D-alanine-D-alanine ligase
MEANLVPGMTYGSSYFPKAFEIEHSLDYDSVIKLIVDEGISRVSPVIEYVEIDCSIEQKVEVV